MSNRVVPIELQDCKVCTFKKAFILLKDCRCVETRTLSANTQQPLHLALGTNRHHLDSENMHLFGEHQQKHAAHLTHQVQPILHRYPITMRQSTSTALVFAHPHNTYEPINLNNHKPVNTHDPYKVAMLKHVRY
jgi:hypothetical protein